MSDASARQRPVAGLRQGCLAALIASLPLVAFMALPAAMPVLLRHFAAMPNARTLVPMLAAAPSACIALLSPLAGALADRFGRRRVALISIAAYGAAGLIPLIADDFRVVLAGRIVLGLANAGLMTLGSTLLADYFEGAARRRWLGASGVIGSALITIALFVGGVLAAWNWRGPLLAPLIGWPIFVAAALWLFEPEGDAAAAGPARDGARFSWTLMGVIAGLTLASAVWFYVEAIQIGLVLDEDGVRPEALVALISAIISIGYPSGAVIYSRIAHRWPEPVSFITGCLLTSVGLIGVGLARAWPLVIVFGLLQQVGGGVMLTMLLHQGQERFAFRFRARAMGVWTSAFFAGQFASPLAVSTVSALQGGLRPGVAFMGATAGVTGLILAAAFALTGPRQSAPADT